MPQKPFIAGSCQTMSKSGMFLASGNGCVIVRLFMLQVISVFLLRGSRINI